MAVCAAGNSGVGPGVKRRFLCSMAEYLVCRDSLLVYRKHSAGATDLEAHRAEVSYL
jgi:hypothetical protein